jgi:hypothetical protein
MNPKVDEIKLSEVVYDEVTYPRKQHDPALVQRYAAVIDEIEAKQRFISVSVDNKLLDGKHRWLAYRKVHEGNGDPVIKVFRYDVAAPHDQLKLAAALNSEHGWQLSEEDKQFTAISLYTYGCTFDDIAATLSIGKSKVSAWLSRTVKEDRDRRNAKIFDLWLSCHTQEKISEYLTSEKEEVPLGTVKRLLGDGEDSLVRKVFQNQTNQAAASHATDFDVPLYNVWKQQEKTSGSKHFGNSEVRWLDNLLYLYTVPFDVVVDPFSGGGSTIDLCKKRFRRYFASDHKPIPERETEIRCHDITAGLPKLPRWKDVRLVYLDPPYWKQAEGKYSKDPTDLANMDLESFHATLAGLITAFAEKLKDNAKDARIALLLQPTQWNAPDREFTDHVSEMIRRVNLPIDLRVSAPYESQQCNAQMVEWAKANRKVLVLTREFVVWRVA